MSVLSALLPVIVHIAASHGAPVVDARFIDERIERANAIFAPYDVQFTVIERRPLAERHAKQETRRDRDRLAPYVSDGAIHCFVVASLRDVDEPGRMRRGVHWWERRRGPAGKARGRHYVILSASAELNVLAHELGHFLGNRAHSRVPGNLMSYEYTEALPVLDAAQRQRLEHALRAYLSTGELREVAPSLSKD